MNQCIVYSGNTDVFLLLIFHYTSLPNASIFRNGKKSVLQDIYIGSCYEALGSYRANDLLGFNTFAGCDKIGHFLGKTKRSGGKTLYVFSYSSS